VASFQILRSRTAEHGGTTVPLDLLRRVEIREEVWVHHYLYWFHVDNIGG
jgi:hypothetical protein